MSIANRESDDNFYRHFHGPGHHGLQDATIQLFDKFNDWEILIEREGQWVYRLRSLRPEQLNDSNFFSVVHKIKVYCTCFD